MRSLFLRSIPLPPWLRDSLKDRECGPPLGLERCKLEAAKLQHWVSSISADPTGISIAERYVEMMTLRCLLAEAQAGDKTLIM